MKEQQLARALGWFSIGLGIAELLAPKKVGHAAGLSNHRALLRFYGARELAAGVSILSQEDRAPWVWSRVAGDAIDLATLAMAFGSSRSNRRRLAIATAAVAGVTALDILCAQQMTRKHAEPHNRKLKQRSTHVTRVITINRSPEELYGFWRKFENLPKVMHHLVSVQSSGPEGKRSRWVAKGPAGTTVEWDAEIINEHPNRLIAWRSLPGATVANAGTVRFEPCPNGRGTFVKVELEHCPPGGALGAKLAKLFGESPAQQIAEDLRHFKQLMETGEIATIEGQPAGRASSTSHRYDKVVNSWAAA